MISIAMPGLVALGLHSVEWMLNSMKTLLIGTCYLSHSSGCCHSVIAMWFMRISRHYTYTCVYTHMLHLPIFFPHNSQTFLFFLFFLIFQICHLLAVLTHETLTSVMGDIWTWDSRNCWKCCCFLFFSKFTSKYICIGDILLSHVSC